MKNRRFPYGYEMVMGKIVVSNAESQIVVKIFNDYLNGKTLKDIADELTQENIEYLPNETTWNKSRIKRIIEDKRYNGDDTYPKIIDKEISERANSIKLGRCTYSRQNCKINESELLHSVICAKCGDRLIHRTDNSKKISEVWYCKNKECPRGIPMSTQTLKDEITDIFNLMIKNPDLVDNTETTQGETSLKIKRLNNGIERALEQLDFNKDSVQNLILECASKNYETNTSKKHITDRIKADFENSSLLSSYNKELFCKTVATVILGKDKSVRLLLKNGTIVGKEQ